MREVTDLRKYEIRECGPLRLVIGMEWKVYEYHDLAGYDPVQHGPEDRLQDQGGFQREAAALKGGISGGISGRPTRHTIFSMEMSADRITGTPAGIRPDLNL